MLPKRERKKKKKRNKKFKKNMVGARRRRRRKGISFPVGSCISFEKNKHGSLLLY